MHSVLVLVYYGQRRTMGGVVERARANDDDQRAAIQRRLNAYAATTGASVVLALDRDGQVLSVCGDGKVDPEPLGALLAGIAISTRALAALLGTGASTTFWQSGTIANVFVQAVAEQWLLVTVCDQQLPLGMLRLHAERAAGELAPLFAALVAPDVGGLRDLIHSTDFRESIDAAIDRLFDDVPEAGEEQ